ncbi:MAG: transcriptional repressor LexA [bacterium]|jgi:repressor LexA|nr:transcriptional repressor LexA [bacterium]
MSRESDGTQAKNKLTPAQERVLNTLIKLTKDYGYPPTTRELAETLGISAPSVYEHLMRLETKGCIKHTRHKARSIEILSGPHIDQWRGETIHLVRVPIIGEIAAGKPVFAEENFTGEVWVDSRAAASGRLFALTVKGDSMIGAGINNGDVVIVRQQPVTEPGEIVAALLDDEATIKRLRIVDNRVFLYPENPDYTPIDVTLREDFRVLGKVVSQLSEQDS